MLGPERSLLFALVFGVADVLAPFGLAFGHGEMCHEVIGCSAVPVPLAARRSDHFTGADDDHRPAPGPDAPFAFHDVQQEGGGSAGQLESARWSVEPSHAAVEHVTAHDDFVPPARNLDHVRCPIDLDPGTVERRRSGSASHTDHEDGRVHTVSLMSECAERLTPPA